MNLKSVAYIRDVLQIRKLWFWVCLKSRRVSKRDALVLATLRYFKIIDSTVKTVTNFYCNFNNRILRERGMASNPKMEYKVFLCIFQKNSATLSLKEMGKFPWEGKEKGLPSWLSQFSKTKLRQLGRNSKEANKYELDYCLSQFLSLSTMVL